SGGTSTPAIVALVGIGISCATQVCSETGALEAAFGEKAAGYIALGGAITGAALTLGGSIWSAASTLSSTEDLLQARDPVKVVAGVANGVEKTAEGVATTVEGVQALHQADYQHDADVANVDAKHQKNVMDRIERIITSILDDLREAKKSADQATEILQSTAKI